MTDNKILFHSPTDLIGETWKISAFGGILIFSFNDTQKRFPNAWIRFWHWFFFGWRIERI